MTRPIKDSYGLINDTKWDEVRLAMHALNPSPRWRTKNLQTEYVSNWDREWYYHFSEGGYSNIEWLEIDCDPGSMLTSVEEALSAIHVPGKRIESGFRVYGYGWPGEFYDYL